MGDVAMTVPVLLALTQEHPNLKITFLTKPFFAPIVSEIPNVKVLTADVRGEHKGIFGLWKLFRQMRTLEIDAVADLHNVLRSNILKLFFRLYAIPVEQMDKGRKEKRELTSGKLKALRPLTPMYLRYKMVFEHLGLSFDVNKHHVLGKQKITTEVSKELFPISKKIIGIAPFAAFQGKVYPQHQMEKLLVELNNLDNSRIILFGGGKKETEILEQWENTFSNCISAAGKLTFQEELRVISNLRLMISMDSGNGHLAAMYGVPVITLWGITHPFAGFTPFGQSDSNQILSDRERFPLIPTSVYGNKFPPGYDKAMETISPQTIYDKIKELL
ncbi:ADP-heptose--LPS heptosyltransferase RfaF [Maribacter cobaltidurans]|uniref:ADP-heptose--LPS heptosyltransferase RfaF n=2 Tax=Maribacter cobaltidurans TaxID=1178778 RepID=A0A223VBC4_9FLAO|nr:ADP-heptose--LPS heptosyltransferase RfaF [Maribacter cobaltidurans]